MKSDLKNIEKPTKNDIENWVNNKLLTQEKTNKVILGLLVHKDETTQGFLEEVLTGEKEQASNKETLFEWFNKVASEIANKFNEAKENISVIFQPVGTGLSPMMMGSKKKAKSTIDFKLYGDKIQDEQSEEFSNYRVKLRSNTNFELKIKLPDGKFLVTLLYANSNNECGFVFPKLNKTKTNDPIINGAQHEYKILEKGDYELLKDESTTFKLTTVKYSEKELCAFQKCIQLGEEMGVVRWLRHIEADKDNKYSVATIFLEAK